MNRIKKATGVLIHIPNDDEQSDEIRIEGSPEGVQQAKEELLEMALRMVRLNSCIIIDAGIVVPRSETLGVKIHSLSNICKIIPELFTSNGRFSFQPTNTITKKIVVARLWFQNVSYLWNDVLS